MTRSEWLTATEPDRMLAFLRGRVSDRKFLLFACGCCHLARHVAPDVARLAVPHLERAAEDALRARDRSAVVAGLVARVVGHRVPSALLAERADRHAAVAQQVAEALRTVEWCAQLGRGPLDPTRVAAHPGQCGVLRDVVGDPFDPAAPDPRWLTATVRGLAAAIDLDRAYDRLPILADALEDAGCDREGVLAHCRDGGPHFRGCWVIDLILGRS